LSKPGMKRVIDFLAVSSFTGGAMLLMWHAGKENRVFASWVAAFSMIEFLSGGNLLRDVEWKQKARVKSFSWLLPIILHSNVKNKFQ
jgi:hypothetical protein